MPTRPIRSFRDRRSRESRVSRREPTPAEVKKRIALMQQAMQRHLGQFGGSKRKLYESKMYDISVFDGLQPMNRDADTD